MVSFWCHFCDILMSFSLGNDFYRFAGHFSHFDVILMSFLWHFGVILMSFYLESAFRPFVGHFFNFFDIIVSLWCDFGVIFVTFWCHFFGKWYPSIWRPFFPFWCHFDVILMSFFLENDIHRFEGHFSHVDVTFVTYWCHFGAIFVTFGCDFFGKCFPSICWPFSPFFDIFVSVWCNFGDIFMSFIWEMISTDL